MRVVLVARTHRELSGASLRTMFGFAHGVWVTLVERRGLVLDTRLVPAERGPERPGTCVYLLAEGRVVLHDVAGTCFDGPSALILSESQLEGANGVRPVTFRLEGEPLVVAELHFASDDVVVAPASEPTTVQLDPSCWVAIEAALFAAGEGDDDGCGEALRVLIDSLASSGILRREAAVRARERLPFARLWGAIRPLVERLALSATLDQVGDLAALSRRQLDRHLKGFFDAYPLVGGGFRAATLHLRLKLAVLFLSAEGATVDAVARLVGYGSTDAMARAFRDAGASAPSVVQAALRR